MLDEELYKEQIEILKDCAKKKGYVPLSKIISVMNNPSDELLDEIVEYLDNCDIEVTRETDELPNDEDLLVEDSDDDFEAFMEDSENAEEIEELTAAVESEIKVSDFEEFTSSNHQVDDPVKMYLRDIGQIELLNVNQEYEYARMVQEGLMCQEKIDNYKKQGKVIPADELESLNEKIQRGNEARDILIESNLRLVVFNAKKYFGRGLPFLDLIQEGNIGLMKAVEKFDANKGYKFSTYATWWIRQAITRAIADQARTIRVPVHMVETINKLSRFQRQLTLELNREPTDEELAEKMGMSPEKVREVIKIAQDPVSLETPIGEEEDSHLGDFVPDESNMSPEDFTIHEMLKEEISDVLLTLTEREEQVLRLRFGLDDGSSKTLEEVGQMFGVTRERIRQIEAKALRKLRHPSRSRKLKDFLNE